MEADSTTYEKNPISRIDQEQPVLPFTTCPGNFKLYMDFVTDNGEKIHELHLVERLQCFGLLPCSMKCVNNKHNCKMICRIARVVDKVQWFCEGCGKTQPIRAGSFFYRLQCTIAQALQIILAWCEDADLDAVAEQLDIKLNTVRQIFNRLDDVAINAYSEHQLGGEGSVVLAELYPDCINRLSPDTTDQPHRHRVLMLADTKHIPTYYKLHLIKEDTKKNYNPTKETEWLKDQIEEIITTSVEPSSMLVTGNSMPSIDGVHSMQHLTHCDSDMQHFLSTRIWQQAATLCAASRDLCANSALPTLCAPAVQRYLQTSLYRLRFGDGFYRHILARVVFSAVIYARQAVAATDGRAIRASSFTLGSYSSLSIGGCTACLAMMGLNAALRSSHLSSI